MSRGSLAALAAVVIMALVATGIGVFLVTRSGDDTASSPPTEPTTTAGSETSAASEPTVPPPSSASPSEAPSSSEDLGDITGGFFPPGVGVPGPLPEGLPEPEGARPSDFGIEVDLSVDAAATFYETALPAEGYTVAEGVSSLPGGRALDVDGNGLTGQLLIFVIGGPETSVLWIPA